MLRNNNDKVIARMAAKSLKNNRRKSMVMLVAVLLSSFMIFSVITVGTTYFKLQRVQNIRMSGADMDAIMYGITDEQMQKCEENPDVEAAGIAAIAGYAVSTEADDTIDVGFVWADDTYWNKMARPAREWVKGRYPEKVNEVMVTEEALEECGLSGLAVGDSFSMVYSDENGKHDAEFTISGIWDGYGAKEIFYVSEDFYKQSGKELSNVNSGRYYIDFNKRFMTAKEQETFTESMELEKQQNLFFVADYGEGIRITAAMIGIILITCLCAYLLIYNIMYLSVSGNIRYYGLLQTVGMTGRQVYRFVQRQMGMIGIAGTAGGLITGGAVSFLIVPSIARSLSGYTAIEGRVDVSFHPAAVILTVVVTALTVYIGSRKPAKLATSVSPVDALRYRRAASGKRGCKNTGKGSIILRMAKQQIFGDRKKYAVVVLSLAASLSVFLCMTTLIESQGARSLVSNFMDMDMVIKNDTLGLEEHNDWTQLMDDAFIENISENEGVSEVHPMLCAEITVPWEPEFSDVWMREFYSMWMDNAYEDDVEEYKEHPENFGSFIIGIDEAEFDYLNETMGDTVDKESFLKGESCILYRNRLDFKQEDMKGKSVACAEYGDSENIREFQIAGLTDESYYTGALLGMPPTVIVSDSAVKSFIAEPFIYKAGIKYREEYDQQTEDSLISIISSDVNEKDFSYESKVEDLKTVERAQGNMPQVGLGIVIILAFIGAMNYINTATGNIQSRMTELAVLESIGMTRRQQNKMLLTEGLIYAAGTLLATFTVGLGVTYYIYQSVNYRGIPFQLPVIPLVSAVILITAVCCLVPLAAYGLAERKESIVERITTVV